MLGANANAGQTPLSSGLAPPAGSWVTLRRLFWYYVLPHWKYGLVAVVAMLAVALSQTSVVAMLRPLLDDGFVEQNTDAIRFYAFFLIAVVVFQGAAHFVSNFLMTWIGRHLIKRLRSDVHERLLVMPTSAFDHQSSGRLISKLTYEVEQTANSVTRSLLRLIQDSARVVFLLGYMLFLSPWLMLIVAVILPIVGGIILYITKRFHRISRRIHRAVGGVGSVAEECVNGYQVIKAFGQEARERRRFEAVNEENRRQSMKFKAVQHAAVPAIRLVAGVALVVLIYLATFEPVLEQLTVGTFVSFAGALMLLNQPLKNLVGVNGEIQKGLAAAQSVFQVVDAPQEPDFGTYTVERAAGRVEFRDVYFSYNGERDVLRGIDLEANPGETLALVGPSGSGKTTLANLIPRFYDPTAGEIRLDGIPLGDYRLENLRVQLAMVGQDVTLFNATVAENIALGAPGKADPEAVRRAASNARATEFIERLPLGFDTVIGEDGVLLSGGQRQRLAIARALLKDAPVLILDEATSALDSESEQHIQAALERLSVGRTSFVIAHRLSTIEKADKILFLENGRVIESGTHTQLLLRDGRYAALYRMHFEEQEARAKRAPAQQEEERVPLTLPAIWLKDSRSTWALSPLALLFGGVAALRRVGYRRKWLKVEPSPVPVIVVGNLCVGGTGKTPLVAWIVERLIAQGWRPGIVSRGYGGRAGKGPLTVESDADPALVGDEPLLLARRTGVPVCIGADRPATVAALYRDHGCDIVVSDDGLQHYRMARTLEIVVLDAERRLGNRRLLPAGPLREPPSRLQSVDLVVANGWAVEETPYAFSLHPGAPIALDGSERPWPGGACHAVAGIGHPQRFFRTVESMGIAAQRHAFPDHHPYTADDLNFGNDKPILMTEKDAVKCAHLPQAERIWWLPMELVAEPQLESAIDALLEPLSKKTRPRRPGGEQ